MQNSNDRPRIAAVVVTYNRREPLKGCLEALLHQDRPLDEILVIDNASTDNTPEMLKEKYDGRITYVRLEENMGGAGGFYEGIRRAYEKGYDWIWVMDDDLEPEPDALSALVASPAFTDSSVGLLGSLILDSKLDPQLWMYCQFNRTFAPCTVVTKDDLQSPLLPIQGGSFLGLMIRREAIASVGLPLKDFFIYWDDTEYTYRISRRFKTFLVPPSKVVHKNVMMKQHRRKLLGIFEISAGLPFAQAWRSYYLVRNGIFFRGRSSKIWLAPFIPLLVVARPAAVVIFLRDHKLTRSLLLCRATIDGIRGRLGKRVSP